MNSKNILKKIHNNLDAKFNEEKYVLSYKNQEKEYKAVRNYVGIIDLSHRGHIQIYGKDRIKFLQKLITNNIMKLNINEGMYSALLNTKAKMICVMKIYKLQDFVLIDTEFNKCQELSNFLNIRKFIADITIKIMNEKIGLLSIHGPNSTKLLEHVFEIKNLNIDLYSIKEHNLNDNKLYIIRSNRTGEIGYDIYVEKKSFKFLWNTLLKAGQNFKIHPFGLEVLNLLRLEAGIAKWGIDISEKHNPYEANLEEVLSFNKGCYIGQEIITRLKHRAKIQSNILLVNFKIDSPKLPPFKSPIYLENKEVGYITSSLISPKLNQIISFGYIKTKIILNLNKSFKVLIENKFYPAYYENNFLKD